VQQFKTLPKLSLGSVGVIGWLIFCSLFVALKAFATMATMYATLATSALKSTPHVAGFRARNGAASSLQGQRLGLRSTFVGEQVSFVSKRQEITPVGVRNGDVCVPRASLDQYAPLTAAVYGACLLGGGLFACKCRSGVHSSCQPLQAHSLNLQSNS
jgi:hypothetical protein